MRSLLICFLLLLFLSGCGSGNSHKDVEAAGYLSSISSSATLVDSYVQRAIESNDTSNLKPVFKETESIRERTKEVGERIKEVIQERDKFKEELQKEEKLIWVDLIYRVAPVVLGVLILLIGRFLTQDPVDTRFGIACFFGGIAINAFYDTIGNWGIIAMITLGIGWFFYSHEKKDLAKKMKATTLDSLK